MLILQLDMLAFVNEAGSKPSIVIGAGVPSEWLDCALKAENLYTEAGIIDWYYSKNKLEVIIRGKHKLPVYAGTNFRKSLKIVVKHKKKN